MSLRHRRPEFQIRFNILKSFFTSLFKIEGGKFHASDLGRIPAESFVINESIAAEMKLWAKLEYGKNSVGFKIVHKNRCRQNI